MSHSVLVVEDDEDTREFLAEALRGDGALAPVRTAGSVEQGLRCLRDHTPDVMLVDLGLPDGSGLELIRSARRLRADTLALVITIFGDEASVVSALEAGARGYLLKGEAPDDVRLSVRQIIAGGVPISPGIASHLLKRFVSPDARESADTATSSLTPREREVLQLLVKGLTYREVASDLGLSPNTVTSHVKKIYRKLEVGSRGEAVFEALSQGIVQMGRAGAPDRGDHDRDD